MSHRYPDSINVYQRTRNRSTWECRWVYALSMSSTTGQWGGIPTRGNVTNQLVEATEKAWLLYPQHKGVVMATSPAEGRMVAHVFHNGGLCHIVFNSLHNVNSISTHVAHFHMHMRQFISQTTHKINYNSSEHKTCLVKWWRYHVMPNAVCDKQYYDWENQ